MRVPPVFDDKETAILFAMYDVPSGTCDSYSLTWKLNPTVENGTPHAGVALAETRDATERLIARGLGGWPEAVARMAFLPLRWNTARGYHRYSSLQR